MTSIQEFYNFMDARGNNEITSITFIGHGGPGKWECARGVALDFNDLSYGPEDNRIDHTAVLCRWKPIFKPEATIYSYSCNFVAPNSYAPIGRVNIPNDMQTISNILNVTIIGSEGKNIYNPITRDWRIKERTIYPRGRDR